MKSVLFIVSFLGFQLLNAQVSADYAVAVSATYTTSPASITLQWPLNISGESYTVYKKATNAASWGAAIATLPGDAISYTDNDVIIDSAYEYKVHSVNTASLSADGYLLGGIQLHAVDHRGTCLLLIDTTVTAGMENEIYRWMKDISGDGWAVITINVARDQSVTSIRDIINAQYALDDDLQCVILFGRVPVIYSGDLNPDGHPDHEGAWPADGIYADVDGNYTDDTQDITVASRPENWNVPGDGKYDQSVFTSKLELEIGRIDMYNLPSFTSDEATLLKNYLNKDHAFRNGEYTIAERGLVDDNFGAFGGEAFASNGWRNFAPMFGPGKTSEIDYLTSMSDSSFLWSYGCGGGWYQGAGGIGSTTDLAADSIQSVFTMLFGSYFGDWDVSDNFLRAPLASGLTLTNCWAGRPYWQFHHMVTGANIGFSTRLSQNNTSTYQSNIFPHWVHIALMGDPTLRMHTVRPVSNVICSIPDGGLNITAIAFDPSPDPGVLGYYVYRSESEFGVYTRITDTLIELSPYIDHAPLNGINYYMVRAITLKETPSGSYYNLSTGITDSVSIAITGIASSQAPLFHIQPNPTDTYCVITLPQTKIDDDYFINDVLGNTIQTGKITELNTTINVSALPAGIYFIEVNNYSEKLVIY